MIIQQSLQKCKNYINMLRKAAKEFRYLYTNNFKSYIILVKMVTVCLDDIEQDKISFDEDGK